MREKVIIAWSGGKDGALALHEILKSHRYAILELLTTITKDYDRIDLRRYSFLRVLA
jgi:diphthamide synthase (EF-2-diphthine--ammonia ligase)